MKKSYLKLLCAILAIMMLASMVACNNNVEKTDDPTTDGDTTAENTETVGDDTTEGESGEATTEEQTTVIIDAGTNTELTRDGTPKKYFTISVDGGHLADTQILSILNTLGVKCATFNMDPALLDTTGYVSADEIKNGKYAGFDVAIQNIDKAKYDATIEAATSENAGKTAFKTNVNADVNSIAQLTGIKPVGMSYAGGSESAYNYKTINEVFATHAYKYARGYKESENFELPKYFLHWMPTCFIDNDSLIDLANEFVNAPCEKDMLFMVALNSNHMEGNYEKLEQLISIITAKEEIVLVNNSEFYQLFEEEIPTWEKGGIVAGTDTTLVRDGKPKKYVTLSFDDGITQDLRIIEILKQYNFYGATFNINTGLYGANWAWVGQQFNRPDVPHLRFTEDELMTGIYDGFEVAVHTLNHPSLKNYDNQPAMMRKEIIKDASNIAKITGIVPVGMAWPGGDTEYTDKSIELILEMDNMRYARGTTRTGRFTLPTEFMKWMPTCSLSDADCISLTKRFLDAECEEDMLLYVWCHGYEFDLFNTWSRLEEFVKMVSEAEDVVILTNAEFYQLFKDEIPAVAEK